MINVLLIILLIRIEQNIFWIISC